MTPSSRDAVKALERAVRRAIADDVPPHQVTEIVSQLAELYDDYDDPALVAREDLQVSY